MTPRKQPKSFWKERRSLSQKSNQTVKKNPNGSQERQRSGIRWDMNFDAVLLTIDTTPMNSIRRVSGEFVIF